MIQAFAIPLGCALAALWAPPASAESGLRLFTADTRPPGAGEHARLAPDTAFLIQQRETFCHPLLLVRSGFIESGRDPSSAARWPSS